MASSRDADNHRIIRRRRGACETCRQKKIRCDGAKPLCGYCCKMERSQCEYVSPKTKPKPNASRTESTNFLPLCSQSISVAGASATFGNSGLASPGVESLWDEMLLDWGGNQEQELNEENCQQDGTRSINQHVAEATARADSGIEDEPGQEFYQQHLPDFTVGMSLHSESGQDASQPSQTVCDFSAFAHDLGFDEMLYTPKSPPIKIHTSATSTVELGARLRKGSLPPLASLAAHAVELASETSNGTAYSNFPTQVECNMYMTDADLSSAFDTSKAPRSVAYKKYLELAYDEIGGVLQYSSRLHIQKLALEVLGDQSRHEVHDALVYSVLANGAALSIVQEQTFVIAEDLDESKALFRVAYSRLRTCRIGSFDLPQLELSVEDCRISKQDQRSYYVQALMSLIQYALKCATTLLPPLIAKMIGTLDLFGIDRLHLLDGDAGSTSETEDESVGRTFWMFYYTEGIWKTFSGRNTALSHLVVDCSDVVNLVSVDELHRDGWHQIMCAYAQICRRAYKTLYSEVSPQDLYSCVDQLRLLLAEWKNCLPTPYRDLDSAIPAYATAPPTTRSAGLRLTCLYYELIFTIQSRAVQLGRWLGAATESPCSSTMFLLWSSRLTSSDLILNPNLLPMAVAATCIVIHTLSQGSTERQHLNSLANAHSTFSKAAYMLKDTAILRFIEVAQKLFVASSSSKT